jgi:retinol dehydrogenase-12
LEFDLSFNTPNINLASMSADAQALPLAHKDLTGRTVIVTGSNVGLGLETSRYFYAMNPARLILAVRDVNKGETAKQSILDTASKSKRTDSTTRQASLEVWSLDLSSFDSVKRFAKRCNEELERLDILLNNAAVAAGEFSLTSDGYELS